MSRARLEELFAEVRTSGRTALLPFMTAGLPSLATSPDLFAAMADSGADAFEVGIPYSDPMMDGPTIQAGNLRALAGGTTVEAGLEVVAAVVARTGKPVLVMTYANPIFRIGPEIFARRCREVGASGVIVADLPLEEAAAIQEPIEATGLGMVLFAAPTAGEARLRAIAAANPVFIYGIADLGVTGERRRIQRSLPGSGRPDQKRHGHTGGDGGGDFDTRPSPIPGRPGRRDNRGLGSGSAGAGVGR